MADNQPTSPAPEEWRPVVGWEGYYEVSDHGRVRSVDRVVSCGGGRTRRHFGRILKEGNHRGKYAYVNLSRKDGTRTQRAKTRYVHQLVLEAFVGPCPRGMETCHADDDGFNNHLSNLRWDTSSQNAYDIVRNGNHQAAKKTHCVNGHEFTPGNTYAQSRGGRGCRACKNASNREYRRRLAAR